MIPVSELNQVGNYKLYLNNKTPFFAVNSLPLVLAAVLSWTFSLIFKRFGLN